jgi:secreted PhoX family phosphatase
MIRRPPFRAIKLSQKHVRRRGMIDRRQFGAGIAALAFGGLAARLSATAPAIAGYGRLVEDPAGLIDLPRGFSYRIISELGERMSDGFRVPDRADGMGMIPLDARRIALVRNHELSLRDIAADARGDVDPIRAFDRTSAGRTVPGGTTTMIYDIQTGRVESQYQSLAGTIRNCAGGVTPWGSWLTCEEDTTKAGNGVERDHGWAFEIPATARGLVEPQPLKAMGRFVREAAAVDPRTGIVYMTEDRDDSLLYRFLPEARGELHKGGRLQALGWFGQHAGGDSRNWTSREIAPHAWAATRWIDLDHVESPDDDLRLRGHAAGGVRFARGEGIHWGDGELYFCCTSGGPATLGQVMRYRPSPAEGQVGERDQPGRLQLFLESDDPSVFNLGDNLTVAPNRHLIVCEDQYTDVVDNHLRGVTPAGEAYPLARIRIQTEPAGVCFSPDGGTLFVNIYSPTKTLAITGPWGRFAS